MMHGPFRVQDVPTQPSDLVEGEWKPVREALGIMGFGVNAYVATAADELLIEDHSEKDTGYEELYIVISGSVDFTLERDAGEDHTFIIPAGNLIFVPPHRGRAARAHTADAAVLVVGGVPGKAFTVSDWEQRRLPE
jgi:quercetin dioxygenase-like cupin family protein